MFVALALLYLNYIIISFQQTIGQLTKESRSKRSLLSKKEMQCPLNKLSLMLAFSLVSLP